MVVNASVVDDCGEMAHLRESTHVALRVDACDACHAGLFVLEPQSLSIEGSRDAHTYCHRTRQQGQRRGWYRCLLVVSFFRLAPQIFKCTPASFTVAPTVLRYWYTYCMCLNLDGRSSHRRPLSVRSRRTSGRVRINCVDT